METDKRAKTSIGTKRIKGSSKKDRNRKDSWNCKKYHHFGFPKSKIGTISGNKKRGICGIGEKGESWYTTISSSYIEDVHRRRADPRGIMRREEAMASGTPETMVFLKISI